MSRQHDLFRCGSKSEGRTAPVTVIAELRRDNSNEHAIAVYDGRTNDRGGELWIWLPRSQITVRPQKDGTLEITLPEWLAFKKEMI